MARLRPLLLLLAALLLAGCAGTAGGGSYYASGACPAGTVMVCVTDSLRGCGCAEFIVR